MKTRVIGFFDFDGSLYNSMTPEPGRTEYEKHHNKPYPHIGWWSKPESFDKCFDRAFKEDVLSIFHALDGYKNTYDVKKYLLTSRILKLKPIIVDLILQEGLVMDDYFFASPLTKGQKIDTMVDDTVYKIYFVDDRQKEIDTLTPFLDKWQAMGIEVKIVKVESDAKD